MLDDLLASSTNRYLTTFTSQPFSNYYYLMLLIFSGLLYNIVVVVASLGE